MRVWDGLKKEISSGFSEEIDTVRRNRPMTSSLPLNEVKDELGDPRSLDDDKAARVFGSFFPHGESNFDDKPSDSFKEDRDQGKLSEDTRSFASSDFWFV